MSKLTTSNSKSKIAFINNDWKAHKQTRNRTGIGRDWDRNQLRRISFIFLGNILPLEQLISFGITRPKLGVNQFWDNILSPPR
jgi:hypothetical protein